MSYAIQVREARAETVYHLEELQRLLRESERGPYWQARWAEAFGRHQDALAVWRFVTERRN